MDKEDVEGLKGILEILAVSFLTLGGISIIFVVSYLSTIEILDLVMEKGSVPKFIMSVAIPLSITSLAILGYIRFSNRKNEDT